MRTAAHDAAPATAKSARTTSRPTSALRTC